MIPDQATHRSAYGEGVGGSKPGPDDGSGGPAGVVTGHERPVSSAVVTTCAYCRGEEDLGMPLEPWRNGNLFHPGCRDAIEEEEADARLDHFGSDEIGGLHG